MLCCLFGPYFCPNLNLTGLKIHLANQLKIELLSKLRGRARDGRAVNRHRCPAAWASIGTLEPTRPTYSNMTPVADVVTAHSYIVAEVLVTCVVQVALRATPVGE